MQLKLTQIHDPQWAQKGYDLPKFDVQRVRAAAPRWVHFGAGNIFRSFIASAQQTVLNQGLCGHGIVVCEGFDPEIVERAYRPFDNLSVAVSLKADGGIDKRLVASVVESLTFADMARLKAVFAQPELQMVSFTITEKGYDPKFARAPRLADGHAADLLRHRMRACGRAHCPGQHGQLLAQRRKAAKRGGNARRGRRGIHRLPARKGHVPLDDDR